MRLICGAEPLHTLHSSQSTTILILWTGHTLVLLVFFYACYFYLLLCYSYGSGQPLQCPLSLLSLLDGWCMDSNLICTVSYCILYGTAPRSCLSLWCIDAVSPIPLRTTTVIFTTGHSMGENPRQWSQPSQLPPRLSFPQHGQAFSKTAGNVRRRNANVYGRGCATKDYTKGRW